MAASEQGQYQYAALNVARLQETSGGDTEFERELLQIFLEDCAHRLSRLAEAVAQQDDKATHREAHTIKGAALNVGTVRLHALARTMETTLPASDPEGALQAMRELCTEYDRLCADVARYLQ